MTQIWPESTVQKTRSLIMTKKYRASNGKVMFQHVSRKRGFIYEAELNRYELRMRDIKKSNEYVQYRDVDELLRDGWALLG